MLPAGPLLVKCCSHEELPGADSTMKPAAEESSEAAAAGSGKINPAEASVKLKKQPVVKKEPVAGANIPEKTSKKPPKKTIKKSKAQGVPKASVKQQQPVKSEPASASSAAEAASPELAAAGDAAANMPPASVPGADKEVRAAEEAMLLEEMSKYGAQVSRNAAYISIVDLGMLCGNFDKKGVVVFQDKDGHRMRSIHCVLEQIAGIHNEDELPGFDDPATVFYVACRADWKIAEFLTLNHFIPAWRKKQLKPADWELAKCTLLSKHREQEHRLAKFIVESTENWKRDPSDVRQAQLDSLLEEQTYFDAEIKAVEALLDLDLLPQLVPADGNCGVWSTMVLLRGFPGVMDEKKDFKEMLSLRHDLQRLWEEAQKDEVWRDIFKNFYLKLDIDSHPLRKKKAPQRECTPPRKRPAGAPKDFSPEKHLDEKRKRCRPAEFGRPEEKNHLLAKAGCPVVLQADEQQDPKRVQEADTNMEILEEESEGEMQGLLQPKRITRCRHVRSCKKKVSPSESVNQEKIVTDYLNKINADWPEFQRVHVRPEVWVPGGSDHYKKLCSQKHLQNERVIAQTESKHIKAIS